MNRPTKITLTLLGIAASVGLGSLIASPWRQEQEPPKKTIVCGVDLVFEQRVAPSPTPAARACIGCLACSGSSWPVARIIASPTPVPKKPLREGYERVKCDKCGEVYDRPAYYRCGFSVTEEERKHFHTTPEEGARKWGRNP